jgi:hypothetical protein
MSWALVGALGAAGAGAFFTGPGVGALGPAPRGGAGRAPGLAGAVGADDADAVAAGAADDAAAASIDARSRRATGASMVLDADLTYSPIS